MFISCDALLCRFDYLAHVTPHSMAHTLFQMVVTKVHLLNFGMTIIYGIDLVLKQVLNFIVVLNLIPGGHENSITTVQH